jgi:hypothetical protein
MKTAIILVFATGIALMFGTDALACGPMGGGKSKSSGGGVGVGGGISIDLSGVGHRQREPDPFAVGGGSQPVARVQKKPQTTRKSRDPGTSKPREPSTNTTSDFANVELTGEKAKGEIEPPKPLNVPDEKAEMQTAALRKDEASTTTPKTTGSPKEKLKAAKDACRKARNEYLESQPTWKKIVHDLAEGKNTEQENKKGLAAYKQMQELIDQFNGNEGKKFVADWKSAYDNAVKAGENTDDYIPPP